MYHQFNIQQFYVLPTQCIYVFCVDLRTNSDYSLYCIKLLVCIINLCFLRDKNRIFLYRVSQEECAILRESVPYVKLYRYNPKHLCPKLNGYGDNGQRSLKLWQLLHTYWLSNTYWNWQEYVVSVMLISVLNIKVTCEWHKAIKLNYKISRTNAAFVLGFKSLYIVLAYLAAMKYCLIVLGGAPAP